MAFMRKHKSKAGHFTDRALKKTANSF